MFHPEGPTLCELARQALSSTERGYDLLAPKFDTTPFRTPAVLLRRVAPILGPPGSIARAVDLGCGTGAVVHVLRPLCRDEVVGVDFSAGMLREAARQLASSPGLARTRFVKADICDLDLGERFEVATCFGVLGHVPRAREAQFVAAVRRLLEPGGRFVFATAWHPRWYAPGALLARGFNLAMAVRNALHAPAFVMSYLRFTLPDVLGLLARHGLAGAVVPADGSWPDRRLALVVARRR